MHEMKASRFIREENDAITNSTQADNDELVCRSGYEVESGIVIRAMKTWVQLRTFQQKIDLFSHVSQTKRHFNFLWNGVCPCHKKEVY